VKNITHPAKPKQLILRRKMDNISNFYRNTFLGCHTELPTNGGNHFHFAPRNNNAQVNMTF